MNRCTGTLIWLCAAFSIAAFSPAPARAQAGTPSAETPGESPKDRYVAEMNNLRFELREGLDRLASRAELVGEGKARFQEARGDFERSDQALGKALAEVAAADPFAWEEYKPAAEAAATALQAAYGKALDALE